MNLFIPFVWILLYLDYIVAVRCKIMIYTSSAPLLIVRTHIFSFPHQKYHFILLLLQYIYIYMYIIFHTRTTHLHVGSLDGAFFAHSNVAFSSVCSVSEIVPTRKLIPFRPKHQPMHQSRLQHSRYSPASSTISHCPIVPLLRMDQLQKIKH
jgi:hypothetical protein